MLGFKKKVEKQIAELKKRTFFDPTYDAVFKRIFSKDSTLIHFLNAMLRLKNKNKIRLIKRRKPSIALSSKTGHEEVCFDVHARLKNGSYVDLEMQRASHEDFLDRAVLYSSQLTINSKIDFDSSRPQKESEEHPYLMPQTYSLWICNFDVPFCKTYREELGLFRFSDVGISGALPVYDKKRYLFIDLTKYKPVRKKTSEALWLEVFTQMATAVKTPGVRDKVIADVYSRMKVKRSPKKLITEVATGMVTQAEISTRLGTARREGREEGRRDIIRKLLSKGKSLKEIADLLDVSRSEVLAASR